MTTEDLSEYEQMRADLHEIQCRLIATLLFIHQGFCHRRACRRNRVCCGPMIVSPHQAVVVRLHKELGLSGRANARLPGCIALQPAEAVAPFKRATDALPELQGDWSDWEMLMSIRRKMGGRENRGIFAHLTSFPDRPTSVAKRTAATAVTNRAGTEAKTKE